LVLVRRCVPMAKPPSRDRDQRFDWLGTILLGIGVSAYCLAVTLGQGGFGALNAVLVVTALVAAVLFVLSQSRVRAPLVRPAAWRGAALRAGLRTHVCVASVMMAFFVIAPFYLSGALGLADITQGAALAISPTISMATGFV